MHNDLTLVRLNFMRSYRIVNQEFHRNEVFINFNCFKCPFTTVMHISLVFVDPYINDAVDDLLIENKFKI